MTDVARSSTIARPAARARRAPLAAALAVAAVGCASDPRPIDAQGRDLFVQANAAIHALHLRAQAQPAWPATFTAPCADGGTIALTTTAMDGGAPRDLQHVLTGCAVNGWTIDGQIDYAGIAACGTSYSYQIVGQITATGPAARTCAIDAAETCGTAAGTACGGAL